MWVLHEVLHKMAYDVLLAAVDGVVHEVEHPVMFECCHGVVHGVVHAVVHDVNYDLLHSKTVQAIHSRCGWGQGGIEPDLCCMRSYSPRCRMWLMTA